MSPQRTDYGTSYTFDQVDHAPYLAGCCITYVGGLFGGSNSEVGAGLD